MKQGNLVGGTGFTMGRINGRKSKDMLLGPITKDMPPPLILDGATMEKVMSFKPLGIHVSNDLKWAQHINAISSKAASRLYFLKQLRQLITRRPVVLLQYSSAPGT